MFWIILIGILFVLWIYNLNKVYVVTSFFSKRLFTADGTPVHLIAPQPKARTIFGTTFDNFGLDNAGLFKYTRELAREIRKSYVQYVMGVTFYNVITPEDGEIVFNNPNLITKGIVYTFLEPFLRTGLLTSNDKKWHARRKILTPAFHFNILSEFVEIFKEESRKFVNNLKEANEDVVSLTEIIPKLTLNNVCETALGVQLDDRLDGDEYRKSFKMIEECFVRRISNPFFLFDPIFKLIAGSKYDDDLRKVHKFSSNIIKKRRELFNNMNENTTPLIPDDDCMGKKKRYAMLDTLLLAEKDGLIDHIGICEEVDTFMFEGFDTTSMGLKFGLMNLSLYPEVQERCYQEIIDNIDPDLTKLDIAQLNKLKYLECFMKESLRMYPPVPAIMRTAVKETKLSNNLVLPAGTFISIHIFDILRDPRHFPNPNVFDPERFTPENSIGRHPFAFVPFSAGQRNCIGQKFAMLEMKALYVYILKEYKLLSMVDPKDLEFEIGIIIRSKNDIKVKLVKRNEE